IVKSQMADKRIVITNVASFLPQSIDDRERWTFAHIIDVFLVRDTQQQDSRAIHGLTGIVQSVRHKLHHVLRHARVHFFRQSDEARIESVLSRFPRKIVWDEWNAVAADSGALIKMRATETHR